MKKCSNVENYLFYNQLNTCKLLNFAFDKISFFQMARGAQNGISNNPTGRPVGTTNKIQITVKQKIVEFVVNDFDNLLKEIRELDKRDSVKAKIELIKLVVPRPLNTSEEDEVKTRSEIMRRLFNSED